MDTVMPVAVPPHPDLAPIAFLLGTWVGEGTVDYPTMDPVGYREEARFWHVGKPFLAYSQRTWALDDSRPLHGEMGYWRPMPGGLLEMILAHPTGVAEVQDGTLTGTRIELRSTGIALSATAKEVSRLERVLEVEADILRYTVTMAAVGIPLTYHLSAELRREASPSS